MGAPFAPRDQTRVIKFAQKYKCGIFAVLNERPKPDWTSVAKAPERAINKMP